MYKIGDFSQLGQVSSRMLRHYDKLGLLKPGEVDQWTGYRYYTIEQLPRLNRIVALRELGFSLEEIGGMVEDDISLSDLRSIYENRKAAIEDQLRIEQERLNRVSMRLNQIESEGQPVPYDVTVKQLPQQTVIGVRQTVPHVDDMGEYRSNAVQALAVGAKAMAATLGHEMVFYFNQEYSGENIDMLFGQLVAGDYSAELPDRFTLHNFPARAAAASIVHRGAIYELPAVISSLYGWAGQNGYTSIGPVREIHHFGREADLFNNDPHRDVIFEVVLPIQRLQTN